jgi:thymidylate kinase
VTADAPLTGGSADIRSRPPRADVPPGLTVALLGPDGAGKSTLAAGIVETSPAPVRVFYLGVSREEPWVRLLRRLPGAVLLVRAVTVRLAVWRAGRHVRRGGVAVFDRYPLDVLIQPPTRSIKGRVTRTILCRSAPMPDLIVVLDAPGEQLYARKREHSVTELEDARDGYRRLAACLPAVRLLDATQPPEAVLRQATDILERERASRATISGSWDKLQRTASWARAKAKRCP